MHFSPDTRQRSSSSCLTLCLLAVTATAADPVTPPTPLSTPALSATSAEQAPLWDTDITTGLAMNQGKPIAILIGTEHCVWCERLKHESARSPAVRAALTQVAGLELRADIHRAFAHALAVQKFPTVILINRKGRIVRRLVGYIPADDLAAALRVLATTGDSEAGEGELPDPTAGIAEALAAPDATLRLSLLLGDGDAERRREVRRLIMPRADAGEHLWPLLTHQRLAVRVDAAWVLAAQYGADPAYDPFQPGAAMRLASATWQERVRSASAAPSATGNAP